MIPYCEHQNYAGMPADEVFQSVGDAAAFVIIIVKIVGSISQRLGGNIVDGFVFGNNIEYRTGLVRKVLFDGTDILRRQKKPWKKMELRLKALLLEKTSQRKWRKSQIPAKNCAGLQAVNNFPGRQRTVQKPENIVSCDPSAAVEIASNLSGTALRDPCKALNGKPGMMRFLPNLSEKISPGFLLLVYHPGRKTDRRWLLPIVFPVLKG